LERSILKKKARLGGGRREPVVEGTASLDRSLECDVLRNRAKKKIKTLLKKEEWRKPSESEGRRRVWRQFWEIG